MSEPTQAIHESRQAANRGADQAENRVGGSWVEGVSIDATCGFS